METYPVNDRRRAFVDYLAAAYRFIYSESEEPKSLKMNDESLADDIAIFLGTSAHTGNGLIPVDSMNEAVDTNEFFNENAGRKAWAKEIIKSAMAFVVSKS
eukprot:522874_1